MPAPDILSAHWGQRLTEQREAVGLTVAALAERVGAHRSQIYKIEKGQTRPSDELRIRLADALSTSVPALFPHTMPQSEDAA